MARLSFHGAARQVTGSCYLLETARSRVLVECGLFQGDPETEALNRRPFPFDPRSLDAVVLSHAHLDHGGRLPSLVRAGYAGPVYATAASGDLLGILLEDAAFLEQKDTEWENRRRERAGRPPVAPLYDIADVQAALARLEPLAYGERRRIGPDVELCLRDAGHILGSAIVELWIEEPGGTKKLVFSGDLGNHHALLLRDPERVTGADLALLESTYGDRDHRPFPETLREFAGILEQAARDGGNVLIPSFAVGRTQEILYTLGEFHREGRLPQSRVFLDSPLAIAANEVHRRHHDLFNREARERIRRYGADPREQLPPLSYSHTPEESMAINRVSGGAVIIAGSGMCSGGRIRHHLKWNLWRAQAHVVFVGFQALGTPGRALVDGAGRISLLGEDIAVRATIHTLGGFSAHAGQSALTEWVGPLRAARLCLVHGEPDRMRTLARRIAGAHGLKAEIPAPGATITF
jgi:metallo-beta-lactamase family protein